MELVRGWESRFAPENTGQIRLRRATFYRDVDLPGAGVRDEKEGKARVTATSSVSRTGDPLSDTTLELHLNEGEDPSIVHMPEGVRQVSFQQTVPVDLHPVPFVFCAAKRPTAEAGLQALKKAVNEDYDAWYSIKDADALGRELEKAIKGWLFDHRVARHTVYRVHGLVHYYDGDRPPVIADLEQGIDEEFTHVLGFMKLWFNKRARFRDEQEYRYAYIVESPDLPTLPDHLDLELTVRATRMFERL